MVHIPSWLKATAVLGAPTIISLYLTWWITGQVSVELRAMGDLLRPHVVMGESVTRTLETIVEIQRIQCVNAASTPEERRACLRAGNN